MEPRGPGEEGIKRADIEPLCGLGLRMVCRKGEVGIKVCREGEVDEGVWGRGGGDEGVWGRGVECIGGCFLFMVSPLSSVFVFCRILSE